MRNLFSEIAGVYDRMNRLLSLGMDRRWRRLAAVGATVRPARALDVACGTGDFSFELARRFEDAEVLGVDLSPKMLDVARRKNSSPRVVFAEGDAMCLAGIPDRSFQLCSCAFGFRNFADRRQALREIARVLASDGELIVLEFFRPRSSALWLAVSAWIRLAASLLARGKASAYRHLRESVRQMDTEEEFRSMAEEAGLFPCSRRRFFPCCTCLYLVSDNAAKARRTA